jgi:pilus assembly protein Flp/PilA
MKKIGTIVKKYMADTSGATIMEYGLIVALLSVALIAAYSAIAQDQNSLWNKVAEGVSGA